MIKPQRFVKRPVEVEAMQLKNNQQSQADILNWITSHGGRAEEYGAGLLIYVSSMGVDRVTPGGWVIRGIEGEFYPCSEGVFEATYDAVTTPF